MGDRDETSCHHLNNIDTEMLIYHRANTNGGFTEPLNQFLVLGVEDELNVILKYMGINQVGIKYPEGNTDVDPELHCQSLQ